MEESKLVYFLRHLSAKDLRDFKAYVSSPYFNEREALKKLLNVLEKVFVKGKGNSSREKIYAQVYGDNTFKEATLKTNMSQLLGLLRDFMAFSKFKEDKVIQNRYFLRKLNDIQEQKYFPKYHASSLSYLKKAPLPAADRYHETMILEEEYHAFRYRQPGRDPQDHMRNAVEHLGTSFLIRMLRYILRVQDRIGTFQEAHRSDFMDRALVYIGERLDSLPMVVRVYYQLYIAITHPMEMEHYALAKALLSDASPRFSKMEANELYTLALNFVARKLNEGDLSFLPRTFELYSEMLEREIIVDKGKIFPWNFKNIVNVGLRLGKFAWVENFIEEWQAKVSPDYAQNAYHFNQGTLAYYRREYANAEREFNLVLLDYEDIFYGLNARGYLLQIYYETGNARGLESLIHSFRMFLDRNQEISQAKKRQYIAFINHLRKLTNIPLRDVERLKKLRREILEKDRRGMGTSWLLAKIRELVGEERVV